MNTKRTLLVTGGLSAMLLWAALAKAVDLQPLAVTNLRGTLTMVQSIPCNNIVNVETPLKDGRIEMSPALGVDLEGGDKIFHLTRMTLFFKPFKVNGECQGIRDSHSVTEIGVRLAGAVSFRAPALGRNNYVVRIPKNQVLLYESIIDNGMPKTVYMKPSEEVTGVIDLRKGTVRLHLVVATQLQFRVGCDSLGRCMIDETRDGTQTADIMGTIVLPRTIATTRR